MTATINLPTVSLTATDLTVRLGDATLPLLRDLPATMAYMAYLEMILGPIGK